MTGNLECRAHRERDGSRAHGEGSANKMRCVMRRDDGTMEHTIRHILVFFCATPFSVPHSPVRIISSTDKKKKRRKKWEHEGRETSTLITIHLRLMCAAGRMWRSPFPSRRPLPPVPCPHLSQPLRQRSSFRWSISLITLRPQAQALVHDRISQAKLSAGSWKSFAWWYRRALTTEGGVTCGLDCLRKSPTPIQARFITCAVRVLTGTEGCDGFLVSPQTASSGRHGRPDGPSDLQSRPPA